MQITFYDKNMIETATADNQLLNAIKIKKASLSSYFEEATHYVEFEFSKETGEWWGIKENGYLAFRFRGKFYRFNIVKFKEDVKTNSISILGDYFNLEMLNENCLAYEKQPSRTIVQHLVAMEILPYANFEIGVNELASSSRVVEYTGEEMKYKRLISLINNFDGECQFEIRQKRNGEFDKLILNIYKANDGEKIQGVGRNRRDLELNIDNTNNISRSVDSTTIRTAIEPTGKDGLRLGNSGKTWRNNDGRVEFEQKDGRIYAVIAAEETTRVLSNDKWLVWKQNFDTDSLDKLESESYKWIKNNCYAKETIEVAGSFDVEIGDTVILNHKGIGRYGLLGTLRVVKIVWDLLTEENEVSFANFKRLSSKISAQGLALQESIETPASYDITFNTTAGQVFKNNTGVSTVSFNFFKNGTQTAVLGQRWYNGTQLLSNGLEVTIKPDMLTDGKLNLRLEVDVTDAITFSKELTFINVNDGLNGSNGRGITSTEDYYLVSASKTGITSATTGWVKGTPQVATATNKYHWHYHVDIYSDGTRKETVPAIIGIYGDQGLKGDPGKDGQNGQIPHIAYADKSTNIFLDSFTNFKSYGGYQGSVITSALNNGAWDVTASGGTHPMKHIFSFNGTTGKTLWYYIKIKNTHATNPLRIVFNGIDKTGASSFPTVTVNPGQTYVKFEQGICRTGYDFIQINIDAVTADKDIAYTIYDLALYNEQPFINLDFVNGSNKAYMGLYIDEIIQSSTDASKYAWILIKGQKGDQGIPGLPGADGKTPFWHTAWANSADGKTDFSLTDSTGRKYRGDYTDYTQVDSTDPTKYKWVDMTANVKVGGANILLNSRFENTSTDPYSFTVGGVTYNTKPDYWSLYNSGIPNATTSYHAYVDKSMSVTNVIAFNESDGSRNWKAINQTVSSRVPNTSKDFMISLDMYATGAGTKAYGGFYYVSKSTGAFNFHAGQFNIVPSAIGKWVRESAKVPFNPDDCDFTKEIRFYLYGYGFTTNSILYIDKIMLENSNVASDHSDAPEELQAKIDSKADQALTQEQLNLLLETQNLMTAEMRTKATAEQVDALIASYNKYVSDEAVNKANVEAELIANAERIEAFRKDYDDKMLQLDFVSNYIRATDLGLEVSASDGSSSLLVQKDRISMFSAGKEVMYISQGFIHIDNGVFTKTLQIGNFRESQADGDPTTNLTIYVG